MKCPHCQAENDANALSCSQCKQKLLITRVLNSSLTYQWSSLPDRTIGAIQQPSLKKSGTLRHVYEPLPIDAIVGDRYLVLGFPNQSADQQIYQVRDIQGMLKCTKCGLFGKTTEKYCRQCGATLQGEQPYYSHFILTESAERSGLGVLSEFMGTTEGVLPVFDRFSQRFGGQERYYLVTELGGQSFATLSRRQELGYLFQWGEQLAKGLELIHNKGWAFRKIVAEGIRVEGNRAVWSDFSQIVPVDEQSKQINLVELVNLFQQYAMGNASPTSQKQLPSAVRKFFQELSNITFPISAPLLAKRFREVGEQIRRPSSIDFRIGRRSDVGMVRQLNEDSLLVLDLTSNNQSLNRPMALLAIADGMGGHEGGEVASGLAVQTLASLALSDLLLPVLDDSQSADCEAWLKKAVQASNNAVCQRAKQRSSDMGTTVVVAVVIGNQCHIAHVGDSRAYHINATQIRQITADHSLVARLVAVGQITPEEARHHPQSNVVYRTLGDKTSLEVDISKVTIEPNDFLLLCSDGVTGLLEDKEIHQIITSAATPQIGCDELIAEANRAGGDDNISVIILKLVAI